MAALDAHLRRTALSSEAGHEGTSSLISAENGGSDGKSGDPFWEAGGLLVAAVIEHACFAAGAVLCARRRSAARHRQRKRHRSAQEEEYSDDGEDDGGGGDDGGQRGDDSYASPKNVDGVASSRAPPSPAATKMYMAVVYPLFFRLLAAFVMIWDRQVAILNTIELLVATMQFVALSAVVGGPATVSGMGEGGVAAVAIAAGMASKMVARGVLCLSFGTDSRTLWMF